MKLWEKGTALNKTIEAFTVGNDTLLDQALVKYDCQASIAHAKMLGGMGILTPEEVQDLCDELQRIVALSGKGEFVIRVEHEDCHTAIENHLTEKLGVLGEKIHTGRSRNDQVLTALRLYYKDGIAECTEAADFFVESLNLFAQKYGDVAFPGYSHTRKAMPTTFGIWSGAFVDSMQDNLTLLAAVLKLMDQCPLGTGAGYGVPLKLDREFTARELGFDHVQNNPIYVQHSRGKFEAILLHALSQITLDLNRVASDLIFMSLPELAFVTLPEEICTGSSIMPQKQNPDVLELVRGKHHEVVACGQQIQATIANLITGYHRDFQLSKGPTMRGIELTVACINIMTLVVKKLGVNEQKCKAALTDEVYATEQVYDLVRKGVPFRRAYKQVADKFRRRE